MNGSGPGPASSSATGSAPVRLVRHSHSPRVRARWMRPGSRPTTSTPSSTPRPPPTTSRPATASTCSSSWWAVPFPRSMSGPSAADSSMACRWRTRGSVPGNTAGSCWWDARCRAPGWISPPLAATPQSFSPMAPERWCWAHRTGRIAGCLDSISTPTGARPSASGSMRRARCTIREFRRRWWPKAGTSCRWRAGRSSGMPW